MSFLTTEQVAERLGISAQDVYESRRRNEHPGNLGVRRGKRLMFPDDLTPLEPDHISADDAMVLELQAVGKLLRKMNAQLTTIARYLERAEARQEEPFE